MAPTTQQQLRAYVDYLRDMGIHDLYRQDAPRFVLTDELRGALTHSIASGPTASQIGHQTPPASPSGVQGTRPGVPLSPFAQAQARTQPVTPSLSVPQAAPPVPLLSDFEASMPKPLSFDELAPPATASIPAAQRAAALKVIRVDIGDCTRCPLAYAGRHNIVFADGDPNARLMFVGEGPGADEDASGLPFVGKAGQLLNNMITAMGVTREQVYIANIVKCRPPQNRTPEPVEANTCSQFLIRQIDVVQPQVIVALGGTAATYLLGVKQSLASLRGRWHTARGAKVAVTYHPAFLLRDPRQKGEAWKDLQMVMGELGLQPPKKS